MVATAIYSEAMVLWKETAFPLCRAMEKRWKRNVVIIIIFLAKNKYHWWLEVRVFVRETEGVWHSVYFVQL